MWTKLKTLSYFASEAIPRLEEGVFGPWHLQICPIRKSPPQYGSYHPLLSSVTARKVDESEDHQTCAHFIKKSWVTWPALFSNTSKGGVGIIGALKILALPKLA